MSAARLGRRLARLEGRRAPPGGAAFLLLEGNGDELPAWVARAPIRAVLDLRDPERRVRGGPPLPAGPRR